jgi:MFS transporter, OPA family, glycerol-3-phosphate transporter
MSGMLMNYGSILILLITIAFVLSRLPKVELGHSEAFKRRRIFNWLPLGLTYAVLYMGRYNLTVSKNAMGDLMSNADFGTIFFWGTIVYGFSFLINGPLTDRIGGRKTIMVSAVGSAAANLAMGALVYSGITTNLVLWFSILYALNMYFQSFGAVAIVKVNAAWFHVRERGTFGGIFGILISLGLLLAYDVGGAIAKNFSTHMVFMIPVALLLTFAAIDYFTVYDCPSDTGYADFDTADASSGDMSERLPVLEVARRMLTHPVILTITLVEFCSGFLRNAIMQWYIIFAKQTGIMGQFVPTHWGLLLCVAGIMGGVFAGTISDKVFHSRRGPVSAVLYGIMLAGAVGTLFLLQSPMLGWVVIFMSMAIIGVHGMLSGTASMDFGGRKNVGVAVGLIDGFVYLGTAVQSLLYGTILPEGDAAKNPANWSNWPMAMVPVAAMGLFLALRVWNARPQPKGVTSPANLTTSELSKGSLTPGLAVAAVNATSRETEQRLS